MPRDSALRTDVDRGGRPATTSAHEIAAAAQRLFLRDGFEETSVEDIAAAVGVSKRTFFRYFAAKADVVWVESDTELVHFREALDASDPSDHPADVVAAAFISSLTYAADDDEWERQRAQLILYTPAVQAHAQAVFDQWRCVIAEFTARRRGESPNAVYPVALAHAMMAGSAAAHQRWLADEGSALADHLATMFALLLPRDDR